MEPSLQNGLYKATKKDLSQLHFNTANLYLTRTYMVTFGLLMQLWAKAAYAIMSARKLSLNLNVIQQGYLLSKQQNRESVIKSHALWTSSSLISCLSSDLKSYGQQIDWLKTTPDFHQLGLWWTLTLNPTIIWIFCLAENGKLLTLPLHDYNRQDVECETPRTIQYSF